MRIIIIGCRTGWEGGEDLTKQCKRKKSPEFATGIELRCCRRQIHARGVRRKEWHSERRVTNTHIFPIHPVASQHLSSCG